APGTSTGRTDSSSCIYPFVRDRHTDASSGRHASGTRAAVLSSTADTHTRCASSGCYHHSRRPCVLQAGGQTYRPDHAYRRPAVLGRTTGTGSGGHLTPEGFDPAVL
ncbi:MAG: hypothetical protein UZ03_NOB001000617, partial [Nitrospira sp. OLB3]